jgi:hypothetical protein
MPSYTFKMKGSELGKVIVTVPPSGVSGNPVPSLWINNSGLVDESAVDTNNTIPFITELTATVAMFKLSASNLPDATATFDKELVAILAATGMSFKKSCAALNVYNVVFTSVTPIVAVAKLILPLAKYCLAVS